MLASFRKGERAMRDMEMSLPLVDRPRMPDGYGVPEDADGLVAWEHVAERLRDAENYWVATADRRGRPHSTPIWGAYIRGMVFLDGSPETRRGRNLSANPQVAVHLESASDVVIVEGVAEQIQADADLAAVLAQDVARKYGKLGYAPSAENYLGQWVTAVRPRVVFAWTEFPRTVTRFRFS
jgi:nitroimidazol reductase NimA-like FMN-containing flavoprotein (pyridoxamine 5'-phosphate oxidase superfamily)